MTEQRPEPRKVDDSASPAPQAARPAGDLPGAPEKRRPGLEGGQDLDAFPASGQERERGGHYAATSSCFRQVYLECEAMARFAFSSGLNISAELAASLENLSVRAQSSPGSPGKTPDQNERRALPPIRNLIEMHRGLSRLVAPATPRSITLLFEEQANRWRFLGPVPLVRHMMFLSILSLLSFVCLSLSDWVSVAEINKGLLQHSGLELLINELFLLSAAALGASFANLFEANKYCTEGSFDPKYNSSYWVRFVLGLIAGLILSEVISTELVVDTAGGNGQTSAAPGLLTQQPMIKPILAMLGGFSSDLVFRVLNRLVGGVESMLRGDPRDQIKRDKQQAKDQAGMETERQRMSLAADLSGLKGKLDGGESVDGLSDQLQNILDKLTQGNRK